MFCTEISNLLITALTIGQEYYCRSTCSPNQGTAGSHARPGATSFFPSAGSGPDSACPGFHSSARADSCLDWDFCAGSGSRHDSSHCYFRGSCYHSSSCCCSKLRHFSGSCYGSSSPPRHGADSSRSRTIFAVRTSDPLIHNFFCANLHRKLYISLPGPRGLNPANLYHTLWGRNCGHNFGCKSHLSRHCPNLFGGSECSC